MAEMTASRVRSVIGEVRISLRVPYGEQVAHSANRMNQRSIESAIDFVAERVDVHLDDVADGVEMDVPDVLDDERLRDRPLGVPHQELEQRVLLRLELDRAPGALDAAPHRVHLEIADAKHVLVRGAAAEQRA